MEAIYCLGDLGGFGPRPERIWRLLETAEFAASGQLRGVSIQRSRGLQLRLHRSSRQPVRPTLLSLHRRKLLAGVQGLDGFAAEAPTDPRRRKRAASGARFAASHQRIPLRLPTPVPFLEVLLDQERCDGVLFTHTGLHWHRQLPSGRDALNVGVIGRPANDGEPRVWYALLEDRVDALGVAAQAARATTTTRWPPRCETRTPGRIRHDHRDRLVDHLPGDSARQRTGGSVRPEVLAHRLRQTLTVDVTDRLHEVAVPILFLHGSRDTTVRPWAMSHVRSVRPDIVVREAPVAHLLLQLAPESAWAAIDSFVAKRSGRPTEQQPPNDQTTAGA